VVWLWNFGRTILSAQGKLFFLQNLLFFPAQEKYEKGIKLLSVEYCALECGDLSRLTNYAYPVWQQCTMERSGAEDVIYHMNGKSVRAPEAIFFHYQRSGQVSTPDKTCPSRDYPKTCDDIVGEVANSPNLFEENARTEWGIYYQHHSVFAPVNQ